MSIKEQWGRLADELGFTFKEGIDAILESPHTEKILRQEFPEKAGDFQQASALLNNPFVRGMLSKVFLGMATGTYRDFEFLVYRGTSSSSSGSGSRRSHYVNTVLLFKKTYNLGLDIQSSGAFSRLGKLFFSGRYIRPRDPGLDSLVVVKGENRDQIGTMLSHSRLQEGLVELYSFSPAFKISDHGIRIKEGGEIASKEHITGIMERMVSVAETFY